MYAADDQIRLEPQIVYMDALLDEVASGRLRVPAFQRPFVWRPEQMRELFDSIERGYPIGSLLVWQTDRPVRSLDHLGGIDVPPARDGRPLSYVLDGHQRLATLFGILRRPRDAPRSGAQSDWQWWIYRDLRAEGEEQRYQHHRLSAVPAHYLPLRAVSRTLDFLEYSRDLESRSPRRPEVEELVRRADLVAQRIKNYQVPLVRLVGGDVPQAVEVFTRLNREGRRMETDQMVSALTYPRDDRDSLASGIDRIITGVAETGFGVLPRMAVFRTVLAIAGERDVLSSRWEAVADRLRHRLDQAVPAAGAAVVDAVDLLRGFGLPLARLLPYGHQLMLLAVFCYHRPKPTGEQRERLRRWFWLGSWTSAFAGASSTAVRRSIQEMVDFAHGERELSLDFGPVRPIPEVFNLNSARTRAYLIWELMTFPDRRDPAGRRFDVVRLIASADVQIFRSIVDGDGRPANRIVLPTPVGMSAAQALRDIWAGQPAEVLASHGIPGSAWQRLREGDGPGFVRERTEFLAVCLRDFVAQLGASFDGDLIGGGDDDTD